MWALLASLASGLGKGLGGLLGRDAKRAEVQSRLNEREVEGAPASRLRLWRSFLGWVLALLFVWEVAGRLVLVPLLAPQWAAQLPPSTLDQIMSLLLGMLGLGL